MRLATGTGIFGRAAILSAAVLTLFSSWASAQERNEYGEISQTVARISYIDGSASFARGDDPDNWQDADQNVPMTVGDRVYTGNRSRLELQVHGGDSIRLGAQTELAALNLTDDTKQFSVKSGIASFQIRRLDDNEVFEIDTPNAAVTVEQPGDYRIDVDQDGNARVSIRRGQATVAAGGGQVPLQSGDAIDVRGTDAPTYEMVAAARPDGWDQWVGEREGRFANSRSLHYVSEDIVGSDDLDQYGRWEQAPSYGWVWSPASVDPGWAPYRAGHWVWQDPWGWTWVSAEPWGWAPYHYGRWAFASSRWVWVPVGPTVRLVAYSPALVAFVGAGPGWSSSVAVGGGGFVGWFPLGPRDPLVPWWGLSSANVRAGNVTYVNRSYVTVINRGAFVSGGLVTGAIVRDRTVLREVGAAPVLRGPLPLVPTAGALHVAVRANLPAAPRPPAAILGRSVVARLAPPPAPPSFQAKLAVIRENRGAPVAAAQAARISIAHGGRAQAITNVRPVVAESGRVTLTARGAGAGVAARKVEPITAGPVRGRPLATSQQPVSTAPVTGGGAGKARQGAAIETGKNLPTVEKGTLHRGNANSTETGRTQTLEKGNVSAGKGPARSGSEPALKHGRRTGAGPSPARATPQAHGSNETESSNLGGGRARRVVTAAPQGRVVTAAPQGRPQGQSERIDRPSNPGGTEKSEAVRGSDQKTENKLKEEKKLKDDKKPKKKEDKKNERERN